MENKSPTGTDFDEKKIADYMKDLSASIKKMEKQKPVLDKANMPSSIKLTFGGAGNSKFLDFLYSTGLDNSLDGIFKSFMNGDLVNALDKTDNIYAALDKFQMGSTNAFQGEISNRFVGTIRKSMDKPMYSKLKHNIFRSMYILHNLKKEANTIKDPEKKKKFKDSIYAFKKIMKLVNAVYRNRAAVNDRALQGMHNAVYESAGPEEITPLWF